jgi:hypothetical protein
MWTDRRTDRHGKANSCHSATLGTRLNKTWVTRTERHDPTDCDAPSYVTFVSSFHHSFTVNCKHHLQCISSPHTFLQTTDNKCSFNTKKTRLDNIRQRHNKFQINLTATNAVAEFRGAGLLKQQHVKTRTLRKWPSRGHTCHITNRH